MKWLPSLTSSSSVALCFKADESAEENKKFALVKWLKNKIK
jgi:hypothetical protein